jgi:hypothetical protein
MAPRLRPPRRRHHAASRYATTPTADVGQAAPAVTIPSASDLLGAASAYASSHPRESPDALAAVLAAANVGLADPRRSAAERALAAALGSAYPDGPLTARLAELADIDGPRGVAATLRAASALAERWELRDAAKPPPRPRELSRDEAKAERRTARQAWAADPARMRATAGERFGPLAASITADYCRRFAGAAVAPIARRPIPDPCASAASSAAYSGS